MSLDKSLKSRSSLERHRNVLKRAERIERLTEEDKWTEESSPFGLPKIAHRKVAAGKKTKTKKQEADGEKADDEKETD